MVTLGFLNLFHGVPYMIMAGTYCRRRWAHLEPVGCGDALTRWLTRHWCAVGKHTPAHTSAHQHTPAHTSIQAARPSAVSPPSVHSTPCTAVP